MVLETYNFVTNHRFLRVMVLVLMVFSLIFCGFMVEYSHAIAFAIPAIAVCATLLVACGVISSTDSDLEAVATAFHNSLNSQASQEVLAIASEYEKASTGSFTFKATKAIVSALSSWLIDNYVVDSGLNIGGVVNLDGYDWSWCNYVGQYEWVDYANIHESVKLAWCQSGPTILPFSFYAAEKGASGGVINMTADGSGYRLDAVYTSGLIKGFFIFYDITDDVYRLVLHYIYENEDFIGTIRLTGATSSTTVFPSTTAQTDTTYFPKEVVDSAGGTTTFPSNTASKPLTTETPLTIPQEGVNSSTIPSDVRTDAWTTEGEGTIIGWLEKVWDGVCAIPEAIAGVGTAVIDFVTDLVVPSDTVWDDFMTDVVDIVSPPNTVNFNKYVSSIAIPDVTGTYEGTRYTFVDNSNLRDNVTTWRKYIGAFLAVLLMIYNYNMFMKLMGLGTLTLTESGRVPDVPGINNLSGNVALPAPKGKR